MTKRVYIETTVIGDLTMRPSRDLIVAAHQQITHEWWDSRGGDYDLCASQLVIDEAGAGDPAAARERLEVIAPMTIVDITPEALALAKDLLNAKALPAKAAQDALHIAIAAAVGIPYLLTWNCRHMNNATMRPLIESVCKTRGFQAPIICSPEELLEESDE